LEITLAPPQNPCGVVGCGIVVGTGTIVGRRWGTGDGAVEMFGQGAEPLEIVNWVRLSDGWIR